MIILSALLFWVMFVWRRGTAVERMQTVFLPVNEYKGQIGELRADKSEPLLADNLVFLTNDSSLDRLDRDILYSILNKRPKRAQAYWFLNVQVTDEPHTLAYSINDYGTNFLFKVQIRLGFKVNQRINAYLRQIVADMVETHRLPPQEHKYSIRSFCGSAARWYGLENSNVILEYVPLFTGLREIPHLTYEPLASTYGPDPEEDEDDIITGDIKSQIEKTSSHTHNLIGGDTASFGPLRGLDEDE